MEPISTAIGTGLVAYASKDLISKLLGPSAEYMGGEIRHLVEKCNINLGDIFNKAARKAGDLLNDGSQVNPRVLKSVISEGSFCDDDTLKEYYAGILTASRSKDGSNDIGVSLLAALKSLSVFQIRLHYLFYHEFHRLYAAKAIHLGDLSERQKRKLFIPIKTLVTALKPISGSNFEAILVHAITGLVKHDLLDDFWRIGSPPHLNKDFPSVTESGAILGPSLSGIELFISANGKQNISPSTFLTLSLIGVNILFPIDSGTVPTFVSQS